MGALASVELFLLLLLSSRRSFVVELLSVGWPSASGSVTTLASVVALKGKLGDLGMTGFVFACVRMYFTGCRLKWHLGWVPRTVSESLSVFSCTESSGFSSSEPTLVFTSEEKIRQLF